MQINKWLTFVSTSGTLAGLLILVVIILTAFQGLSCSQSQTETIISAHSEEAARIPSGSTGAQSQAETEKSALVSDPAISDSLDIPITPTDKLSITGGTPTIDMAKYRLTVEGMVEKPLTLTYDEVLKYPAVTATILLVCPDVFSNNAQWTGIPVSTLLMAAGLKQGATRVIFVGADGYKDSLSPEEAKEPGVFLANLVNGKALPAEHGFPLRVVAKGKTGNVWIKWVERIIVS